VSRRKGQDRDERETERERGVQWQTGTHNTKVSSQEASRGKYVLLHGFYLFTFWLVHASSISNKSSSGPPPLVVRADPVDAVFCNDPEPDEERAAAPA